MNIYRVRSLPEPDSLASSSLCRTDAQVLSAIRTTVTLLGQPAENTGCVECVAARELAYEHALAFDLFVCYVAEADGASLIFELVEAGVVVVDLLHR